MWHTIWYYISLVLNFCKEYYQPILLFFFILGLIITSSKNKQGKKKDNAFIRIFKAVCEAEKKYPEHGSGALKLAYVFSKCFDLDADYVNETVEEILSSPQKKYIGGSYENES